LRGEFLSWESIPQDVWISILENYFYKISDSFGFDGVLEKKNLFPAGLDFFNDWDLQEVDLVEFEKKIVCRFNLNENCKERLLYSEFAVHQKGMSPPRNYWEFDADHFYYELDVLYFFKESRLIGYYVNHDSALCFINDPTDLKLLYSLDESITKFIIESTEIEKTFGRK
jgi:hypothetical protein